MDGREEKRRVGMMNTISGKLNIFITQIKEKY